jgi:hypothetical protein
MIYCQRMQARQTRDFRLDPRELQNFIRLKHASVDKHEREVSVRNSDSAKNHRLWMKP